MRLGDVLDSPFEPIALRRGLDLNWVINGRVNALRRAARITDPQTGIAMDVSTTQPGVQVYTNNETQHYPDSPNHPEFPSTLVTPTSPLHEVTVYRFSIGG